MSSPESPRAYNSWKSSARSLSWAAKMPSMTGWKAPERMWGMRSWKLQPCPRQRRARKPLPYSPLCSSRKRARSCLEKRSKSTRTNSLKPTSLEAGSEIICDLCAVVSFIVLCLIRYFTTNWRTLELTHVLGTVSSSRSGADKSIRIRPRCECVDRPPGG